MPTEAEWEFAARGGLDGAEFAWGDEFTPGGKQMANTWQGEFPSREPRRSDGFERTSPVNAFPPNGYGVYDMIGNVWEWTDRLVFTRSTSQTHARPAASLQTRAAGARMQSYDAMPAQHQDPAQGDQGRLAPVRAELLPPLPTGRAPRTSGRHIDEPHRLSLHRQN